MASITRSQSARSAVVERALDPPAHGIGVRLLELALLDRARKLLLDLCEPLVELILRDLDDHDVPAALLRAHLGDPVPHEAATDDADRLDLHALLSLLRVGEVRRAQAS